MNPPCRELGKNNIKRVTKQTLPPSLKFLWVPDWIIHDLDTSPMC
jgi:hypothetical protein